MSAFADMKIKVVQQNGKWMIYDEYYELIDDNYGNGFESANEAMRMFKKVINGIRIVPDKKDFFRYVIQDFSGRILDDAQGYGYKSIGNAYRAYKYKTGKF